MKPRCPVPGCRRWLTSHSSVMCDEHWEMLPKKRRESIAENLSGRVDPCDEPGAAKSIENAVALILTIETMDMDEVKNATRIKLQDCVLLLRAFLTNPTTVLWTDDRCYAPTAEYVMRLRKRIVELGNSLSTSAKGAR